ncbi:unnamed protein product, partial [Mesorhabditis spiculigera]
MVFPTNYYPLAIPSFIQKLQVLRKYHEVTRGPYKADGLWLHSGLGSLLTLRRVFVYCGAADTFESRKLRKTKQSTCEMSQVREKGRDMQKPGHLLHGWYNDGSDRLTRTDAENTELGSKADDVGDALWMMAAW